MKFKKSSIPNYLTVFRIILAAIAISVMCVPGTWGTLGSFPMGNYVFAPSIKYLVVGIIFVIASITDFLDGYLARKYNWVSDWGKIWDPLADKILVNGLLITMSFEYQVFVIIPVIMIVRDIIVDGYRIQASNKGIIVPANKWGKWKTNLQLFGVSAILLVFNNITLSFDETLNGAVYYLVQNGLLFVATILSVISGAFYVKDITKKLNAAKL